MLGPGFFYVQRLNLVLANTEAAGAVRAIDSGRGFQAPMGIEQRTNPHGFPMTIRDLSGMVKEIRNRHPWWRNNLYLLGEFYRISSSIRLEYRDMAMAMAVIRFRDEWNDVCEQFKAMDPPEFIPMPMACITSNPRNVNNGAGLVRPVNGTLDEWC